MSYGYHQIRAIFMRLFEKLAKDLDLKAVDDSGKDPAYVLIDDNDKLYARAIWRVSKDRRRPCNGEREFYFEVYQSTYVKFSGSSVLIGEFVSKLSANVNQWLRHRKVIGKNWAITIKAPQFEVKTLKEIDPNTPIHYVEISEACKDERFQELVCRDWD